MNAALARLADRVHDRPFEVVDDRDAMHERPAPRQLPRDPRGVAVTQLAPEQLAPDHDDLGVERAEAVDDDLGRGVPDMRLRAAGRAVCGRRSLPRNEAFFGSIKGPPAGDDSTRS